MDAVRQKVGILEQEPETSTSGRVRAHLHDGGSCVPPTCFLLPRGATCMAACIACRGQACRITREQLPWPWLLACTQAALLDGLLREILHALLLRG